MPQRMSVTPPAIHTLTPAGKAIMAHPKPAADGRGWWDQAKPGSSGDDRSADRSRSSCRLQTAAVQSCRKMPPPAAKAKAVRSLLTRKRSEARYGIDDARSSTVIATIHIAAPSPTPAENLAGSPRRSELSLRPTNPAGDQDRRRTRPQWGK